MIFLISVLLMFVLLTLGHYLPKQYAKLCYIFTALFSIILVIGTHTPFSKNVNPSISETTTSEFLSPAISEVLPVEKTVTLSHTDSPTSPEDSYTLNPEIPLTVDTNTESTDLLPTLSESLSIEVNSHSLSDNSSTDKVLATTSESPSPSQEIVPEAFVPLSSAPLQSLESSPPSNDVVILPVEEIIPEEEISSSDNLPNNQNKDTSLLLTDGIYLTTSFGYKNYIYVEVTIKDNLIQSIKVGDHGDTSMVMSKALAVIDSIIQTQSTAVDVISGATFSSTGIIDAVNNALKEALQ